MKTDRIKWIYVAAFIDLFAVSLVLPSMSGHLKSLGASYFMIGMMTSIYACTQLLSGPIIGSWSDKIGRQKIFMISYVIVGLCYPILGFMNSLYIILLLRATIGIFKHGQVLIRTMVADHVPIKDQPSLFGRLKSVAGMSFTIGPAIGGHLAELEGGFSYTCCCTGALLAINSVIGYMYFEDLPTNISTKDKDNEKSVTKKKQSSKTGIIAAIHNLANVNWREFGLVFLLKFILDMSVGVYHSNYNIKIQERFNLSPKYSGYTISFQSLVGVLTGFFIGSVTEKYYRNDSSYRKRNLHGFITMTLGYIGVFFSTKISVFLFWTIVLKTSHMFMRIVLTDMLMRRSPVNQTGSVSGTANSVSNLARLVTPLTAGFFEDIWGTHSVNLLASIITAIGVFVSLKIQSIHVKKD